MKSPCRQEQIIGDDRLTVWHWPARSSEAPHILALHGFAGSGLDFSALVDASQGACHWWAPDWWGHQSSAWSSAGDQPWAWSRATLDHLVQAHSSVAAPLHLFGYSMGARLLWDWWRARENPSLADGIGSLNLLGARPGLSCTEERATRLTQDRAWAEALRQGDLARFFTRWDAQPVLQSAYAQTAWRQEVAARRGQHSAAHLAEALLAWSLGSMPAGETAAVTATPVVLLHGEADTRFAALQRRWQRAFSVLRLFTVPASSHAAHGDNPRALASLLAQICR